MFTSYSIYGHESSSSCSFESITFFIRFISLFDLHQNSRIIVIPIVLTMAVELLKNLLQGEHPPSSMLAENRASCSYTPRQNRATVGLRLAGLLSARVSAHTVTHNGEHPFLLSRVYNPECVLVIAPSACLAYCRIFYLHRFYK